MTKISWLIKRNIKHTSGGGSIISSFCINFDCKRLRIPILTGTILWGIGFEGAFSLHKSDVFEEHRQRPNRSGGRRSRDGTHTDRRQVQLTVAEAKRSDANRRWSRIEQDAVALVHFALYVKDVEAICCRAALVEANSWWWRFLLCLLLFTASAGYIVFEAAWEFYVCVGARYVEHLVEDALLAQVVHVLVEKYIGSFYDSLFCCL